MQLRSLKIDLSKCLVFSVECLVLLFISGCGTHAKYIMLAPPTQKQSKAYEETIQIKEPIKRLAVGEILTYSVSWTGIPVGTARLYIKEVIKLNGTDAYHIVGTLDSNKFLSKFYKIEDRMETYMDIENLTPIKFERDIKEGPRYRKRQIIEFDRTNNIAVVKNLKDNSVKNATVPKGVQDSLSCGYFFRTQNIKIGNTFSMVVNEGEKNWDLEAKILGVQQIEVSKLGRFDAFVFEPKATYQGKRLAKGKVWIWFSTDERRLPLIAKIQAFVGSIGICLEKIETVH